MKTALSVSDGRIAPVLDVSETFMVNEKNVHISGDLYMRAERLAAMGVSVLICGAASGFAENVFLSRGITLIPFICGETEAVIKGLAAGDSLEERFLMPGCCGRRGDGHSGRNRGRNARCRGRGMGRRNRF